MSRIRIAVSGAIGRMGREVVKMVLDDKDLELVGAVSRTNEGKDVGTIIGRGPVGINLSSSLEPTLLACLPDVLVDFTTPQFAVHNTKIAILCGVCPVIGTTGFIPDQIKNLDKLCRSRNIGGIIAPNFSIGAVLMMEFAARAAKYFPSVEIIETHGEQKLDAPSGTAMQTAAKIQENREERLQGHPNEKEMLEGARGGYYNGFRVHSLRIPGVFAQQEVIFGSHGETLKIRHDSYERSSYMPGVNTAIKKVQSLQGIVYGFEHLL